MRHFAPPSDLAPEQRRREFAGILATGILRLRKHRLLAGEPVRTPHENSPESPVTRLEVSDKTVLSVHAG